MKIIRKTHDSAVVGDDFILSDATVDRYGDSIDANGWVFENFSRNPIALFNHQSGFPIGTWTNLRVQDNALRGHLKMAPAGTSERIDELRKLRAAGILKAVSVGFIPLSSTARKDEHGYRIGENFVKQELIETSLVSVPANPNALAVAKSLRISDTTMREVFNRSETSSIAQRIRGYRRSIRNLKDQIARETDPKRRAIWMRSVAHLETAERDIVASLQSSMSDADRKRAHSQEGRAKAEALLKRIDDRLIAEYEASWEGQLQRQRDEIEARRWGAPQDSPKPTHDSRNAPYGTWRGVKLPGPTWRGKPIR